MRIFSQNVICEGNKKEEWWAKDWFAVDNWCWVHKDSIYSTLSVSGIFHNKKFKNVIETPMYLRITWFKLMEERENALKWKCSLWITGLELL